MCIAFQGVATIRPLFFYEIEQFHSFLLLYERSRACVDNLKKTPGGKPGRRKCME